MSDNFIDNIIQLKVTKLFYFDILPTHSFKVIIINGRYLQFLVAHKSNSLNLKSTDHVLAKLFTNMQKGMDGECQLAMDQVIGVLVDVHSCG